MSGAPGHVTAPLATKGPLLSGPPMSTLLPPIPDPHFLQTAVYCRGYMYIFLDTDGGRINPAVSEKIGIFNH